MTLADNQRSLSVVNPAKNRAENLQGFRQIAIKIAALYSPLKVFLPVAGGFLLPVF